MTLSSATVTRVVPTTPKCPTRSRLWTSTTPSFHWTTCVYVSQITPLKSQKKTLNCRCPLSGETHNMLCYYVITHMHYLYLIYYFFLFFTRITFPISNKPDKGKKRKADDEGDSITDEEKTLIVEPYVTPNRGPYPYNQPKRWVICRTEQDYRVQKPVECVVPHGAWCLSQYILRIDTLISQ